MAVDFNLPTVDTTYTAFPTQIIENIDAALQMLSVGSPSNVPTNAIKWDSSANRWKKFNGSAYVDLTGTYDLNAAVNVTQLNLGDDEAVRLGDSNELQLFHRGSDGVSILAETGSSYLSLQSNGSRIEMYDSANNRNMASFFTGGACTFKHGATTRIATTNSGATITGDLTTTGQANIGTNVSLDGSGAGAGGSRQIDIGAGRTADGASYIDLIGDSTYTTYGLRLIRNGGANANAFIQHRGTGDFKINAVDAGGLHLSTNSTPRLVISSGGNIGIGGNTLPTEKLDIYGGIKAYKLVLTRNDTVPEIELNGSGPNFIRFTDSGDASHSLDLIFRSTPNTLAIEKSSDATVLFSVDNDNGQVIVSNNLDVGAGCDVTGTVTATTFSGSGSGLTGVLATQINFVPSGTNAVTRTVDSKLEDVLSVKDFGAVGDGTTDDTNAIQAALNSAASVFFPNAKYRITSTLSQTVLNQKLYGNISRGNDLDAKIFLDSSSSSNGVINVRAPGCKIESLVLEGKGSTVANSYVIDANEEGFDSANNGDVDLTLINCNITDAKTLVKITGRGLQADSSSFVSYTNAIEIDWPSNFVAGSNPDQKLKTAMRSYGIRGCRFHGGSNNFALQNVGSNAANIHGLQFTDNYIDTDTAIFKGHLHDSLFSNNVVIHSAPSPYFLFDVLGGSNFQINNNVFYGMDNNDAGTELDLFGIAALTNCVGCQIDNNTINRVERDIVSTNGTCSNISVSGNIMKNICLSNDGGTTRSPVRVNAAIDKLMVKNNIIDLTEITPSSWNKSEIIKNTGNYAITDHDVRGNMFDPTYWNLHNFPNASTDNISESDRKIHRYIGNNSNTVTSQTINCAFKPLAVMAFNTNNNESLMVSCSSDTGSSSIDISGYDVIVKSDFNTNGSVYFLYIFQ